MEATDAEKENARRTQRLLYVVMAVFIVVPLVIFILRSF